MLVCNMQTETRPQGVTLFDLSWEPTCCTIQILSIALHMMVTDHINKVDVDFGGREKF